MGRITLYRAPSGWTADMSLASGAPGIRALFGTDQIPTSYTQLAPWRLVRDKVARLNPGDAVEVDILSRERDAT